MQNKNWLDNHELFYSELLKGIEYQKILEEKIHNLGIAIHSSQISNDLSPKAGSTQYKQWTESRKDLEKARKKFGEKDEDILIGKGKILCECKSRDLEFKDASSFPYPDIFIDTVSGYEKKKVKPTYTFCISQKTKAIIYLDTSPENKDKWIKKMIFDKKRGIKELNYSAPKELWKNFSDFKNDFTNKYGE